MWQKKTVQAIIKSGVDILKAKVLVKGITFKENVSDIRNSKVIDLVKELKGYSVKVDIEDPHADNDELIHEYGIGLSENIESKYDAIILAVNHKEYAQYSEEYFEKMLKKGGLLVDLKGIFRKEISKLNYWTL